ncbi:hypothetical protein [Enterococcus sp. AZ103]|uniref:hypothetical protein n=1 Tax=Enterococcus sp. AZ103 TaxID=2774628 RepID=UPI003F219B0C
MTVKKEVIPNLYDRVMVTDDNEESWRMGQLVNIEDQYFTVGFYNPNSGDYWIDIFDIDDENVKITLS